MEITSKDREASSQYVGYPDFLTVQNSIPMPITTGEKLTFNFSEQSIFILVLQLSLSALELLIVERRSSLANHLIQETASTLTPPLERSS